MAFIDLDSEDAVGNPTFYNVTEAVGYGCKNMTEDVKVVQFFLKRFYMIPVLIPLKPWGTMTVDGKVGPITRAWITKAQIDARASQLNVLVDGIVDRAGNANNQDNYESSISHTAYLIRILNKNIRKFQRELYKTLTINQEVPPDLRSIFQQMHAAGPPMNYGNA